MVYTVHVCHHLMEYSWCFQFTVMSVAMLGHVIIIILYLFSFSTLESTLVQSIKRMWWRLQWCWSETISGLTFSRHLLFVVTMCYIACRWAVILAFDVRVEREAQEMADNLGVKIFTADIIYHLFDSFMKHREVSSATSEPLRGWFTMWCKD